MNQIIIYYLKFIIGYWQNIFNVRVFELSNHWFSKHLLTKNNHSTQNLHMEDVIVIPMNPTWRKHSDVFSEFQDHQDVQDPGTVKLGFLPAINPLTSTVSANIPDWIWLPTPLVFLHRQFLTFQDLQLSSITNWRYSVRKLALTKPNLPTRGIKSRRYS